MPTIRSSKKRVQIAERNRTRNVAFKSAIRSSRKKVLEAVSAGEKDIDGLIGEFYSLIDRAVLKGIVKKNTGARYKSRVMQAVHAGSSAK